MAGHVDPQQSLPELELRVIERWRSRDVARETRCRRAGAPVSSIWERPAGACGQPADELGARALADVFARYATMCGWQVERRGARDLHTPAVEVAAERQGAAGELTGRCRAIALASASALDAASERLGLQACAGTTSRTLDRDYVESVWWAVKEVADAGLLYEDVTVVPYCPRCATGVAAADVAHRDVAGRAAYVRFKVARDGGPLQSGDELLVRTAAPWTLVANAAVAVDPELTYVRAKTGTLDAPVVVAESAVKRVLGAHADVRILERFRGAAIDGVRYEPPLRYCPATAFGERGHSVLLAGFVSAVTGTGLASATTAFDEDDRRLGARFGLAVVNPVAPDGTFDERAGRYAGRLVTDAAPALIEDLRTRGRLLRDEATREPQPHCGACDTPLLPYAKASWHVAARRPAAAGRVPGRSSRRLSYDRRWGTPLPVWRCAGGHVTVVGSFDDLEQRSGAPLHDPHRPDVDDVAFACACGEPATRVADLVAPWFATGAMPFATRHEPFAGELSLDELYPPDLVCAPPGAARDWLTSLRTVAGLVHGDEQAYDEVVHAGPGTRDPGPNASADALRWQALSGEPGAQDVVASVWSAYVLAASLDPPAQAPGDPTDLDRSIRSRASATVDATGERLDARDATGAAGEVAAFADDLCGWYARCSRVRLRDGAPAACHALRDCLVTLAHLLAPFMPFVADEIYEGLDGSEPSVHLCDWPVAGARDVGLESAIGLARGA